MEAREREIIKASNLANVSGKDLLKFISEAMTNTGRSTFYNLEDEQRQSLLETHSIIIQHARPFYTLMSLPQSVNDVNKHMIAWNIIEQTLREEGLRPHEHSPITKWENEVFLQVFDNMQPNRVFDFFTKLAEGKKSNRRTVFLFHEWLRRRESSWSLWALKYRKPFKIALRHFHTNGSVKLKGIWRYLRYNEVSEHCDRVINDYIAVQNGDQSKLAKLPASIAEGFMTKFGLTPETFWKEYSDKGGRFTAKEKRTKATSVKKASGVDTGVDLQKMNLFDMLVYLNSLDRLPQSEAKISKLIENKAKRIADTMPVEFGNVGVVFDNSLSMYGTKEQAFHPMLKAMGMSAIIKALSSDFTEYRTNESDKLFPGLYGKSNYADSILKAIKDGKDTIIIIGDGYENTPFDGATHSLLYAYNKKIDKSGELKVLHFNPVFAAEAKDVRNLTDLAPHMGVRDLDSFGETLFLAIARYEPQKAIKMYASHLASLQNDAAKALMPQSVRDFLPQASRTPLLRAPVVVD